MYVIKVIYVNSKHFSLNGNENAILSQSKSEFISNKRIPIENSVNEKICFQGIWFPLNLIELVQVYTQDQNNWIKTKKLWH